MRSRITVAVGIMAVLSASISLADSLQIQGSAHDFGGGGFGWSNGEICKPCHTPHHAMPLAVSSRLWNHRLTTATYALKPTDRGDPTTGDAATALDPISRLCMSCHDGTVGMDAFGGAAGTNGAKLGSTRRTNLSLSRNPDTDKLYAPATGAPRDLSNDHPVGIYALYDTTSSQFNTALNISGSRITVASRSSGSNSFVYLYPPPAASPYAGQAGKYVVSCYSCHDPHGTGIAPGGDLNHNLLRINSDASELCLTCHNK